MNNNSIDELAEGLDLNLQFFKGEYERLQRIENGEIKEYALFPIPSLGVGLISASVKERESGEIVMQAYADEAAVDKTIRTGYATFYSRSSSELWTKGEKSGNRLNVREMRVDCDQDAIQYLVDLEKGGACHTKDSGGTARLSCFYRAYNLQTGKLEFIDGMK